MLTNSISWHTRARRGGIVIRTSLLYYSFPQSPFTELNRPNLIAPRGSLSSWKGHGTAMGDESRFIASKRIHRHRRCCAHCEEILGLVTVICPRCDRLATTWWHKLM